jgi:hypothetical protein
MPQSSCSQQQRVRAGQLLSIAAMALALDQRYRLTDMCCRAFTRILLDVWLPAGLGWQQAGQPHVGVLIQRPRRPAGPRHIRCS